MFKLQYVAMKQFKSLLKQVHSSVHSLSESMVYENYFFELPNSLLFSAIVGTVSRKKFNSCHLYNMALDQSPTQCIELKLEWLYLAQQEQPSFKTKPKNPTCHLSTFPTLIFF